MSFTIKYRRYNPSAQQPGPDVVAPRFFYDAQETIDGPFAFVSQEMVDGYVVVYAHRSYDETPGMTYGPCKSGGDRGTIEGDAPRPTLWVMNEAGATVAKYDL